MDYEVFYRANTKYLEYLPLKLSVIEMLHKGKLRSSSRGGFYYRKAKVCVGDMSSDPVRE